MVLLVEAMGRATHIINNIFHHNKVTSCIALHVCNAFYKQVTCGNILCGTKNEMLSIKRSLGELHCMEQSMKCFL